MSTSSARRAGPALVLLGLVWGLIGCGGGQQQVPVTGTVSLAGKPLTAGSVTFHPDAAKGTEPTGGLIVGPIDQGRYTLSSGGKPGAPAGSYKVTVTAGVPSNPKNPYSVPRSLINRKYTDPSTTPLTVEVRPDAPAQAYDLTVTR